HTPPIGCSRPAGPRRRQRGNTTMGREQPLRISCDDCPGGSECRDCLVEFFLTERNARVVRLGPDHPPTADLAPHRAPPFAPPPPTAPPPRAAPPPRHNGAARAS